MPPRLNRFLWAPGAGPTGWGPFFLEGSPETVLSRACESFAKKKSPGGPGAFLKETGKLQLGHIRRLLALRPVDDIKLHFLTFCKGPEAGPCDRSVVDEDVIPVAPLNEAESL